MIYIFLAIIFVIFGLVFLLSYKFSRNSEKQFEKNAFVTTGTVVSRKLNSDGYMSEIYVNVVDQFGTEKEYLSQSFRPTTDTIPPGTEIKVSLAEKKTLGIKTYELKIIDERYAKVSTANVSMILLVLSIIFFIAAIVVIGVHVIK